jgi:LemA protein
MGMEFLLYGTVGALGVAGLFGYKMFATYNRLMALDERCNTAYADIDVLMKHRHTLLPGLLDTVKGYLKHETDILDKLLTARDAALKET